MTKPRVTLAEVARALGVEATRECNGRLHEDFAGGAHCEECNSTGFIPLTLAEIVDAGLAKMREQEAPEVWKIVSCRLNQWGYGDLSVKLAECVHNERALPPRENPIDA